MRTPNYLVECNQLIEVPFIFSCDEIAVDLCENIKQKF